MSCNLYIPVSYLFDAAECELKDCVNFTTTVADTGDGIYYNVGHTLTFEARTEQPGVYEERTLDIYPMYREDDDAILKGFMLSAWRTSCEDVIRFLGMPSDSEII